MNVDVLLAAAMNPLRTAHDRRMSYDSYEREQWFNAVMSGRLKLCDLQPKWAEEVRALDCTARKQHATLIRRHQ